MHMLFNGDAIQATHLYGAVIQICPAVLRHRVAIYAVARAIGRFQPKDLVHGWLDTMLADSSSFCRQAYGELLMLYNCHHGSTWSDERVRTHLKNAADPAMVRGLAYAAGHLWREHSCQAKATEVLCALAAHPDTSIQSAVAQLFGLNRDNLSLNSSMRRIIKTVGVYPPVLLKSARDLLDAIAPFAGTEPDLVAQVSETVLRVMENEGSSPARSMSFSPDTLTDIALTLHRQTTHRERGLKLFEQMLAMNIREARSALDLLDRKPVHIATRSIRTRRRRR
jgi:hypothetical protein